MSKLFGINLKPLRKFVVPPRIPAKVRPEAPPVKEAFPLPDDPPVATTPPIVAMPPPEPATPPPPTVPEPGAPPPDNMPPVISPPSTDEPEEDPIRPEVILEAINRQAELLDHNAKVVDLLADQTATIGNMARQIKDLEEKATREHVQKPMLLDLVSFYDSIASARRRLKTHPDADPAAYADQVLDGMETELMSLLARHGVTRIQATGPALDTRRQKIVQVEWMDPPKDGEVLRESRRGFEWDGQVIRPEEVIVRRIKSTK